IVGAVRAISGTTPSSIVRSSSTVTGTGVPFITAFGTASPSSGFTAVGYAANGARSIGRAGAASTRLVLLLTTIGTSTQASIGRITWSIATTSSTGTSIRDMTTTGGATITATGTAVTISIAGAPTVMNRGGRVTDSTAIGSRSTAVNSGLAATVGRAAVMSTTTIGGMVRMRFGPVAPAIATTTATTTVNREATRLARETVVASTR